MGNYSYHHLQKTYGYLETLSERAKVREGWESKSGFHTSKVRYFRARAAGCLLPLWGTERSLVLAQGPWQKAVSSLTPVAGRELETCWVMLTPGLGLRQLWDGISGPGFVAFGKTKQQGQLSSKQDLTEQRYVGAIQFLLCLSDFCEIAVPFLLSYLVVMSTHFLGICSLQKGKRE